MGIVTKAGDRGMTSLYLGGSVSKDDPRVEAYGTLDELCSFLGLASAITREPKTKKLLRNIQEDLCIICTELATETANVKRVRYRISGQHIGRIEDSIKKLDGNSMPHSSCFCLSGKTMLSASLDVARAIARRAERRVVSLKKRAILKNKSILIYLNRLSDLLYLLARNNE